jgi:SAM-dependent methyltransferase
MTIDNRNFGVEKRSLHLRYVLGHKKHFNSALELGCGAGYLLNKTNAKTKIGLDIAPIKLFKNINYMKINLEKLKINQFSNFDLIICSEVIEHLKNDKLLLKKAHSFLRKNGLLFLTTINKNIREDKSELDKKRGHIRRYDESLKLMLEKIGFKTIKFYPFRSQYYFECKKYNKRYNFKKDIKEAESSGDASGWVYLGRKV